MRNFLRRAAAVAVSTWRRFYEKYGRDHYYKGPENDAGVDRGVYFMKVYNWFFK